MTRDEILDAIKQASEIDPRDTYVEEIHAGMVAVVSLADEYMENGWDMQYMAEALRDSLDSFADALRPYI